MPAPAAPDVVILSSIDWAALWQGPQEMAVRLGRMGRKVLYVENTGVRAPRLSDARRVVARLRRWGQTTGSGPTEIAPNVWLCSPLMLPPFGPPWQRALNRRVFVPRVVAAARGRGLQHPQVWTFLPTDTCLDILDGLAAAYQQAVDVVYHCHADFSQVVAAPGARLDDCERRLVDRSRVVFSNSSGLARRLGSWSRRPIQVMPWGVSTERLSPEAGRLEPPPELAGLPRPMVGYVGGLHRHLALDMLIAIARARPHWSFVYVGSVHTDVGKLAALPNVHLVGPRPHAALPDYLRHFDVCTIPYARSVYTETVVPTKLHEYLAMGKPVVSTDLPALADAPEVLNAIWTAPPQPEPFLAALDAALAAPAGPEVMARRRALAERAGWDRRLDDMLAAIQRTSFGRADMR